MADTSEIENQVANAVDVLLDISRQLGELAKEVEQIRKKVNAIESKLR